MLQEIQNAANKPEKVFIDSRQLKICCTCFDLTLALLRVLEMIVTVNPHLITKPDTNTSDLILSQLATLLNQILNRITTTTGCFEFVTELDIPGLEPITHFPMLSAVIGVLVGLTLRGLQESRDTAVQAFVSDASFVASNLIYLKSKKNNEDDDQAGTSSNGKRVFRFADFKEVNQEEAELLEEMITLLLTQSQLNESTNSAEEISDDDMCTICYANRKTALFVPCGHKSCR